MTTLSVILILMMIIAAAAGCVFRDLLAAAIAGAAVSLIASILFFILQAPDVAMAEAAIGAGLSTAIFVFAIRKTERMEK